MFFQKKPDYMKELAQILANSDNREAFLGVRATSLPTPQQVRDDASLISHYSNSPEYQVYAQEVWGRILNHLDAILNEKTTYEQVQYHRGALKEALDLLRVSYQARNIVDQYDRSESLPR